MSARKEMNEDEKATLDRNRRNFQKTVVGARIIECEFDRKSEIVRLLLDSGRVVRLEAFGDCCAWGSIHEVSALVNTDHVITSVKGKNGGESWFIYAGRMKVGSILVSADEGSGYYGYGIRVEVGEP